MMFLLRRADIQGENDRGLGMCRLGLHLPLVPKRRYSGIIYASQSVNTTYNFQITRRVHPPSLIFMTLNLLTQIVLNSSTRASYLQVRFITREPSSHVTELSISFELVGVRFQEAVLLR